jgi:hypothetical protein
MSLQETLRGPIRSEAYAKTLYQTFLYMSDNSISDKTLSSISFNKFNMRIDRDMRQGQRRDGIGSSNMYIQRDINKASIKIKAVVTEQRH